MDWLAKMFLLGSLSQAGDFSVKGANSFQPLPFQIASELIPAPLEGRTRIGPRCTNLPAFKAAPGGTYPRSASSTTCVTVMSVCFASSGARARAKAERTLNWVLLQTLFAAKFPPDAGAFTLPIGIG
jgi:hypothetical protein